MVNIKKRSTTFGFILMIIFLVIPYFQKIFFRFYLDSFFEMLIEFICYTIAIFLCISYCFAVDLRRKKKIAIIIILAAPLFFFLVASEVDKVGEIIFISKNEEKLNDLVTEVKKYDKIRSLYSDDNYSSFIKRDTINNISITENEYTILKRKLAEIKASSYNISIKGTIYFVLGGFMGDDEGIAYSSKKDSLPSYMYWRNIKDNWYFYLD